MGLEHINSDVIGEILEKNISSYNLLLNYRLTNKNVQKNNVPTKNVEYDFTFISDENKREMFVRIKDFYSYQNLVIWIVNLESNFYNKIDIKLYFLEYLKNNGIKQKLIFKSNSELELEKHLSDIFRYLLDNFDNQLNEIIKGEKWIEMPFDWGDYK